MVLMDGQKILAKKLKKGLDILVWMVYK
jgi:hypothetical protein